MRQLVLLRGAMGVGKSTWVKENNLEQYTLSPDILRNMFGSVRADIELGESINGSNESKVWNVIYEMLETRMKDGAFTIVDATHAKQSSFSRYRKLCDKYRYRCFIVEFKEDLEVILQRNKRRERYKIVPEDVVRKAYARLNTEYVPRWMTKFSPDEALSELLWRENDLNKYEKVLVFGDIHSSFNPLREAIEQFNNGEFAINPNHYYIFCGDYFDRGLQPVEVFKFLQSIVNLPNVALLEGNHERHLVKYSIYKEHDVSHTFNETTLKPLLQAGITTSEIRDLCRKLQQLYTFKYHDKHYIVTHGGVSDCRAWNLMATSEFINGVGGYEDNIDEIFNDYVENTLKKEVYQIHGHRNMYKIKPHHYKHSINLETGVENGGFLSVCAIDENGISVRQYKNNHFTVPIENVAINKDLTVAEFMEYAKRHKHLKINELPNNINSYNFTKKAFRGRHWDDFTVTSRGLFIDTKAKKVIARGYEKFFNAGEVQETRMSSLSKTLKLPIDVYHKYNGFLGLVSVHNGELKFFSKSTSSDAENAKHPTIIKRIFYQQFDEKQVSTIHDMLAKTDTTMIFEVISPMEDPHIIEYDKEQMVLLDIVKNQLTFKKTPYKDLFDFATRNNIPVKEKNHETFNTWYDFYSWYVSYIKDYSNEEEGVVEDAKGFQFKVKSPYYNFWKGLRGMLPYFTQRKWSGLDTSRLWNEEANNFAHFCKDNIDESEMIGVNLIKLRNQYKEYQGGNY